MSVESKAHSTSSTISSPRSPILQQVSEDGENDGGNIIINNLRRGTEGNEDGSIKNENGNNNNTCDDNGNSKSPSILNSLQSQQQSSNHQQLPTDLSSGTTPSLSSMLDAQKAFQKLTSQMTGASFGNSPISFANLPQYLAFTQNNPLFQRQFMNLGHHFGNVGTSNGSVRTSPDLNDDDMDHLEDGEPEDLSVSINKKPDDDGLGGAQAWSYEEQFKQLYELSEDSKRKEWLDDWLSFMHKIGKPVTRIPIMAKQVLDLYELYRLVVHHGGLVEIINKKLWREITKGLNLPSSITSAAFTLRTQYQKYLYDYECEKEGLSRPEDLQQAIDGNRREGRRNPTSGFPGGGLPFHLGPNPSALFPKAFGGFSFKTDEDSGLAINPSQHALAAAVFKNDQMLNLDMQQRFMQQTLAAEAFNRQQALNVVAAQQLNCMSSSGGHNNSGRDSSSSLESGVNDNGPSSAKRIRRDSSESSINMRTSTNSNAVNFKINSMKHSNDSSMMISMELNGKMYQGVLYAMPGNGSNNKNNNFDGKNLSIPTTTAASFLKASLNLSNNNNNNNNSGLGEGNNNNTQGQGTSSLILPPDLTNTFANFVSNLPNLPLSGMSNNNM
uniref:ARID domain-containing protein n=1 Tax=Parastrongyloides trichosuri TaxID=131310 RepID=A0A0N4ZYX1_PARTI